MQNLVHGWTSDCTSKSEAAGTTFVGEVMSCGDEYGDTVVVDRGRQWICDRTRCNLGGAREVTLAANEQAVVQRAFFRLYVPLAEQV